MEDSLSQDEINDHYKQSQMRFPLKLWHLLFSGSNAILWGGQGRSILLNLNLLEAYLRSAASIFKTSHLSSFIRQLNLYGFRKVTSHQQDPMCNSTNPHMQEYAHDCFMYKRPDLVCAITRRPIHAKHNFRPKEERGGMHGKSCKLSMLERARSSFRCALADAVRRVQRGTRSRTPSPPPSHRCVQYYFTDLSDREEPEELDLELPSRLLPHPLLPSENVIHVPLPSLTSAEVPALRALDNLHEMEQESTDTFHSVPPHNLVIYNNEGCMISDWNYNAEKLGVGTNALEQPSTIDCGQSALYNITEQINPSLNNNCVSSSYTDTDTAGELQMSNVDRREWEELLQELGHELDPASPATTQRASDLRQLYLQISRTMDLLNP